MEYTKLILWHGQRSSTALNSRSSQTSQEDKIHETLRNNFKIHRGSGADRIWGVHRGLHGGGFQDFENARSWINGGLGSTRVAAARTKGPWLWMSLVMRGWGLGKSLALSRCSEVLPELCLLHLLLFRRWHWSTRVCTSAWTLPLQRTGFGFPSKDRFCGEWFTARLLSAPSAEPKAASPKSGSPTREQRLTSGVTEWYSCHAQVGSHRHPRLKWTRLTGKHTDGGCCLPSWFLSCLRAASDQLCLASRSFVRGFNE